MCLLRQSESKLKSHLLYFGNTRSLGSRHFMNSATMQGRKKTTNKSTQNVGDGRMFRHQSKRRSTRNAGKPHRRVVEEEGSSTSGASSERDTSNSSNYNTTGGESEGSELPVASSVMKEQKKAASKRTPTINVMYPSPPTGFVSQHDSVPRAPSLCVCFVFFSAIWYYVILCLLLQIWCLILVAWYVTFCFLVCKFVFVYSLVCVILCFLLQSHV
jgi:hypothetical protein